MNWRADIIDSMTSDEARTVLALVAGGWPEVFDWALDGMGGSLGERFKRARQAATTQAADGTASRG